MLALPDGALTGPCSSRQRPPGKRQRSPSEPARATTACGTGPADGFGAHGLTKRCVRSLGQVQTGAGTRAGAGQIPQVRAGLAGGH